MDQQPISSRQEQEPRTMPGAESVKTPGAWWRRMTARWGVAEEDVRLCLESVRRAEPSPERSERVSRLAQQVQSGEYQVDAQVLADLLKAEWAAAHYRSRAAGGSCDPAPQHWTLCQSVEGLDEEEEEADQALVWGACLRLLLFFTL